MTDTQKYVQESLFALADKEYKNFHSKLIPTVNPDLIMGVRVPALRKFAKAFGKTELAADFINILPHKYYEENNLHGFLIEQIRDFEDCINALDKFLPFVDNWATCDMTSPNVLGKNTEGLLIKINEWIKSEKTYTVRYGIGMLMRYFLDEKFDSKYPDLVSGIKSDEYYINMMIAWYFATALAKQRESALPYIENKVLDAWVHNKAIQKAVESNRITPEQKLYLKTLKIKSGA
ncbi:MAG: DNA alkylation repair protein [Candidatus Fimenecus sp.]